MASGTNWDAIRAEYVTGTMSQAVLCKKHGVSARQIAEHARLENWVRQRKEYRRKTTEKAIRKASDKDAAVLQSLLRSVSRLSRQMEKGLSDDEQLFRHLVMVGGEGEPMDTEERIYKKMDAAALRQTAGAIKELTAAARDLLGVRSAQQEEEYQLALRKIALEEAKSGLQDADDAGTGVILMPDVTGEPQPPAEGNAEEGAEGGG